MIYHYNKMSEKAKRYREYTAYPKKYEHTYWGSFYHNPEPHIVENRNRFITDYDIKNFVKHTKKYRNKASKIFKDIERHFWFDHFELYSLNNSENLLAVISPYSGRNTETRDEIIGYGWTEIYPIFSSSSASFIYII